MKRMIKNAWVTKNKSGETMIEVLVAFTVLSMMLLLFSQGIAWATKSEVNASNSRSAADTAALALQEYLAKGSTTHATVTAGTPSTGSDGITSTVYTVTIGTEMYTYTIYSTN